jgi:hypothetical protein
LGDCSVVIHIPHSAAKLPEGYEDAIERTTVLADWDAPLAKPRCFAEGIGIVIVEMPADRFGIGLLKGKRGTRDSRLAATNFAQNLCWWEKSIVRSRARAHLYQELNVFLGQSDSKFLLQRLDLVGRVLDMHETMARPQTGSRDLDGTLLLGDVCNPASVRLVHGSIHS